MNPSLDLLWNAAPAATERFAPDSLGGIPDAARRYLAHAIQPGAPVAEAARLRMHGTIRLKAWKAFRGEEVIRRGRGFIWRAAVSRIVRGYDALVDGEAALSWKLLGAIPLVRGGGADVIRSAAGRYAAESVWLPTMLLPRWGARWEPADGGRVGVAFEAFGAAVSLELAVEDSGRLRELRLLRWGDWGGGGHAYHPFGGIVEEERTFGAFTIPTRLRVGWGFGTDAWAEGEFFRVEVGAAEFR